MEHSSGKTIAYILIKAGSFNVEEPVFMKFGGDGGILASEGGNLASDGGILASDGGNLASDGGNLASDGGILVGDGGNLAGDGGNLAGDGGVLAVTNLFNNVFFQAFSNFSIKI